MSGGTAGEAVTSRGGWCCSLVMHTADGPLAADIAVRVASVQLVLVVQPDRNPKRLLRRLRPAPAEQVRVRRQSTAARVGARGGLESSEQSDCFVRAASDHSRIFLAQYIRMKPCILPVVTISRCHNPPHTVNMAAQHTSQTPHSPRTTHSSHRRPCGAQHSGWHAAELLNASGTKAEQLQRWAPGPRSRGPRESPPPRTARRCTGNRLQQQQPQQQQQQQQQPAGMSSRQRGQGACAGAVRSG